MIRMIGIGCLLAVTAIVFYKTIITKEWRNQVPDEASSWHWFLFYYNPQDARLFVPKRTGLGWTINMGQPLAIVITVLLVVGLIALRMGAKQ